MHIMCQNKIRLVMWQEKKEEEKLYVFACYQPTTIAYSN